MSPRGRDQQDRVIARQCVGGIAEHDEVVRRDPPVAGKGGDHVRLTALQRAVHEARRIGARPREAQPIAVAHRPPFGPGEKFEISAEAQRRRGRCKTAQIRHAEPRGLRPLHRQRIGILEPQWPQQPRGLEEGIDPGQRFRARCGLRAVHRVGPDRPRIIDIDIDIALAECTERHRRSEPFAIADRIARVFEPRADQPGENILLGEILRADHHRRRASASERCAGEQQS